MNLPQPLKDYSAANEAQTRSLIERDLMQLQRKSQDYEPTRLILKSANGSRWQIVVSDAGVLSATAL